MMADFFQGTLLLFSDPLSVALFVAALLGGMAFGAVPGVNMLTLGAVLLPFSATLSTEHALMVYAVIYCTGVFGGAITAILFNIPGSPENAPTAIDGYAMARRGEAAKAVGAAVVCSALGGVVSALVMMSATPLVAHWATRAFGPPEVFSLIVLGLAVSIGVGAGDLWRGALSVLLGLLLATVGSDPADGIPRYDFGSYYLLAGIGFIPVLLGLFAVSEVLDKVARREKGPGQAGPLRFAPPSLREFWGLRATVLRSLPIGLFAGSIPGIGAVLAAFLSYGAAARLHARDPGFGKGDIRGVVASETANNAATGAAMIPLLALGLPGGALTAMMAGVLQLHGITPGPLVFETHRDMIWLVFAAMVYANLAIFVLGWLQTRTVVHLLRVPFHLLAPAILTLAVIGAYALRTLMFDVWVMVAAGVLGLVLRRGGYSIPGVALGLILGELGEGSFTKSMQMLNYQPLALFERPLCAVLLLAAAAILIRHLVLALRPNVAAAVPSP
jgi:putative tricarboxylic transport membrane protein